MLQTKEIDTLFCYQQSGDHEIIVRPGDETSDGKAYLGFDNKLSRFVTIDLFPPDLPAANIPAIEQRIEIASQIVHPNLPLLIDAGKTENGSVFVTSEFVEGEPLFNYLQRDSELPGKVVAGIILQICDALHFLKHAPRLLASIDLSDFWVCLDRGRLLSVRLGHYGIGREEKPIGDFELVEKWVKAVINLHKAAAKPGDIVNPAAYDELLNEAANRKLYPDDLPKIKVAVLESMNLPTDIAVRFPSEMRTIESDKQLPAGIMFQMMTREGQLGKMLNELYVPNPSHVPTEFSPFSMHVAKPLEDGKRAEPVSVYLIPPERLFEENIIDPIQRKMFDSQLRGHPAGFRIRSLSCETHFSYVTTDCYEGFPLPCLQASRGLLRGEDALSILRQIHNTMVDFENAGFDYGMLNPWQVQICFLENQHRIEANKLMKVVPFAEWPSWMVKIRVEQPAEVFFESSLSTWRYLFRRTRGKDFLALMVWMMEQERFEWAMSNGVAIADQEPLSWNPRLDDLFISAVEHLDPRNRELREKFLAYFDEARDRSSQLDDIGSSKQQSLLTSPKL